MPLGLELDPAPAPSPAVPTGSCLQPQWGSPAPAIHVAQAWHWQTLCRWGGWASGIICQLNPNSPDVPPQGGPGVGIAMEQLEVWGRFLPQGMRAHPLQGRVVGKLPRW